MTGYSLLYEAKETMCDMLLSFPPKKEKRVIELINSASTYPSVSRYQLAKTRMMLVDLYIVHEFYGSAWEQLQILKEEYDRLPWKEKEKKLTEIREKDSERFQCSQDANMVNLSMIYQDKHIRRGDETCRHTKTENEIHGTRTSTIRIGRENLSVNASEDSNLSVKPSSTKRISSTD